MTYAISGRIIDQSMPPYVIAEMSCNHLGSLERAKQIVIAAKEAGADAVKLQTYTADTMTLDMDGPGFRIEGGLWHGRRLHDLYEEAHTPWDWHPALFELGDRIGIAVFSSPFDASAVDVLAGLSAPAYKIASFELVDLALIRKCAETGRPIIMSTGMADLAEISEAVNVARAAGNNNIALLHAISGYPTPASEFNLQTVSHLSQAFGVPVGISDHTLGIAVPVAAAALGARIIEKHLTLRRADGGPDSAFSSEPEELTAMVQACRDAWASVGHVSYQRAASEAPNAVLRRSLYVVKDIAAGELFGVDNVRAIRPGLGLKPKHLSAVLGCSARHAISRGTPLDWSMIGSKAGE